MAADHYPPRRYTMTPALRFYGFTEEESEERCQRADTPRVERAIRKVRRVARQLDPFDYSVSGDLTVFLVIAGSRCLRGYAVDEAATFYKALLEAQPDQPLQGLLNALGGFLRSQSVDVCLLDLEVRGRGEADEACPY
jgi:hypothetical protein